MGASDKKVQPQSNDRTKDPMSVTWTENYSDVLNKYWSRLPRGVDTIVATLAIFILGISISGDWINIVVHLAKQFGYLRRDGSNNKPFKWSDITMESLHLNNLVEFLIPSMIVSYSVYFVIGGFLHWYFYVRRRDQAEEWKCQPKKWLSPELERHEIVLGSITLFMNSAMSAFVACYVSNGGFSTVYYDISEYGWLWFFLQWPVVFIYQDYVTYWIHRIYHTPFLYKHFHKLHHKYKQPTAFSVTAIHPFEALSIQAIAIIPIFVIPVHWFSFYAIAMYVFYHGIIDHSGVNFKAHWWQPWQPDAIFHDNHHQYFHVNFAFNVSYWDKLHGTYRQKNRVYTEEIFYGKGKGIEEVSNEELKADLAERASENPLAYRDNTLEFKLSKTEVAAVRSKSKKRK